MYPVASEDKNKKITAIGRGGDSMAEKEAQRENMSGEGSMCGQAAGEALQQGLAFPRKPYLKLLGQSSEQER